MMEWFESLVLGAVQGVTEFLPISSDGHLVITQHAFGWLTGKKRSGEEDLFFDVMLHVGTLAAIVVYYRAVAKTGAKGLLGSTEVPPTYRRSAVIRVGLLAAVATSPLVPLKLFFLKWIEQTFESTAAAGIGFLITAAVLLLTLVVQRRNEGGKGPLETTWLDALLIGVAQMFAPLPGVSRSGLTIAAALGLGLSRAWAVGFSLLIAVPAIVGAAVFEIRKVDVHTLSSDRVAQTVAAAVLAGLVGYGAIICLVKIVRSGRMWYFSVYLIVLGLAVLAASAVSGVSTDARREKAVDRSVRGGAPGAPAGRAGGALAGSVATGAGAAPRGARGLLGHGEPAAAGLVLVRPLAGRP
jgi:undecaprenyl-diphosphatase